MEKSQEQREQEEYTYTDVTIGYGKGITFTVNLHHRSGVSEDVLKQQASQDFKNNMPTTEEVLQLEELLKTENAFIKVTDNHFLWKSEKEMRNKIVEIEQETAKMKEMHQDGKMPKDIFRTVSAVSETAINTLLWVLGERKTPIE